MRMQKVNPAIGSAGIHNNFLGQTLTPPFLSPLHLDDIKTVTPPQNLKRGPGNKPKRLQIMTLLFLAADFIDGVKLIENG